MKEDLARIEREFERALAGAGSDPRAIEAVRIRFLGRRGELTLLVRQLPVLAATERPEAGRALNALKERLERAIALAAEEAGRASRRAAVETDRLDLSLPPRRPWSGSLHPVTLVRRDLERIFRDMGFTVEVGPEVEDDFHNFEALNLPPDHPARDATDTFYLEGGLLLRTHTSPVQIRTLRRRPPPIRMICPGRVYRRDMDATHLPMFHQLEALVVDEAISLADLKGTMDVVWKWVFGPDVEVRLRPGYFPFVEPGAEFDISCTVCGARGCRACKGTGWLEMGGAGMVHPAVFEAVGLDPERWSGFAFGLGVDRIAMMRYGVDDLRLLMENDLRFLRQFSS